MFRPTIAAFVAGSIFTIGSLFSIPAFAMTTITFDNINPGTCDLAVAEFGDSFTCTFPLTGDTTGQGYVIEGLAVVGSQTSGAGICEVVAEDLVCFVENAAYLDEVGEINLIIGLASDSISPNFTFDYETLATIVYNQSPTPDPITLDNIIIPGECQPNPVQQGDIANCEFQFTGDYVIPDYYSFEFGTNRIYMGQCIVYPDQSGMSCPVDTSNPNLEVGNNPIDIAINGDLVDYQEQAANLVIVSNNSSSSSSSSLSSSSSSSNSSSSSSSSSFSSSSSNTWSSSSSSSSKVVVPVVRTGGQD